MKQSHRFAENFDAQKLAAELETVQASWISHFNTGYYRGEWSGIPLRSPLGKHHALSAGDSGTDEFADEVILQSVPYTRGVLSGIRADKLAVRYLRLTPGSEVKAHRDHDMIFRDGLVRLHIPVITNDDVEFVVGDESLRMKPGELWFADFSQVHRVINRGKTDRIHLVIDCRVNDWLTGVFINEGIIEAGERKPDDMDRYPEEVRRQIAESLLAMGTQASRQKAREIIDRYL